MFNFHNEFEVSANFLQQPYEFSSLWMELNSRTTFSNFLSTGIALSGTPIESYDYFEPRVAGWKFTKPPVIRINAWISPDYRKKLAIDVRGVYRYTTDFNINTYSLSVGPRLRVNDQLFMILSTNYTYTHHDRGYVFNEIDSIGFDHIYFGQRNISTFNNTFNATYIFSNRSSVGLRIRHYISQADYTDEYYKLEQNGSLVESDYQRNHDVNFNSLAIDLLYTWYFAPGSEMTVAWKNVVSSGRDQIQMNYFDNLDYIMGVNALNSLSVKFIYYLDYLYLMKSKSI